jgi:hypothetical protein
MADAEHTRIVARLDPDCPAPHRAVPARIVARLAQAAQQVGGLAEMLGAVINNAD